MSEALATFVRWVAEVETHADLVEDAKARTWEFSCEHAVFRLKDGRWLMVKGATWRIELERGMENDPFGRTAGMLYVDAGPDEPMQPVASIEFHTHPEPTGPSDDDMRLLEMLQQPESVIYEIFGRSEGTKFRPKNAKG